MKKSLILSLIAIAALPACARQSTPSMMNTSRVQVVPETTLGEIPANRITDGYIASLADQYQRYGAAPLQLTLAYDPDDKSYSAMKAFNTLADVKARLRQRGVTNVSAETVKSDGTEPVLMVSYDSVTAAAPAGCRNMPGFDDGLTTEKIGDYRFGCSVDTLLARQVYRPGDLLGNAASDPIDGRRAANTVEYYRQVTPEEAETPIERIERTDIQAQ